MFHPLSSIMVNNLIAKFCLLALVYPCVTGSFWTTSKEEQEVQSGSTNTDEPVEYGVDVSFPIHYAEVSTNYPWLEHNVNPDVPTPKEYDGMVIQPLGNRQKFYKDFLDSCRTHFGSRGELCTANELDRIAMSLRQPQSMQVG